MSRSARTYVIGIALGAGLAFALGQGEFAHATISPPLESAGAKRADFRGENLSADVRSIAQSAVQSGDHKGLPFIVIDKANAKAVVFDRNGRLIRSTPVLIGMGIGDTWAPGVLQMHMHQTQPWQRITPAGRFVADEDRSAHGQRVLWVDYDAGIAIHKLPSKKTAQRRHERIRSEDPAERRITYGCINVPPAFYDQVIHPTFRRKGGVVYVLPDSSPVRTVFQSHDVGKALDAVMAQQNAGPSGPQGFSDPRHRD